MMAGDSQAEHTTDTSVGLEIEHTKHLFRAFFLLVFVILVAVLLRGLSQPASFGAAGHYRLDSVEEYKDKPLVHADPMACAECHPKQANARARGRHAAVSCEVCHPPPAMAHVTAGVKSAEVAIDRSNSACLVCHQKLIGRPREFPQIERETHLKRWMKGLPPARITNGRCLECHEDPHGVE
jgi:hypothetical protein